MSLLDSIIVPNVRTSNQEQYTIPLDEMPWLEATEKYAWIVTNSGPDKSEKKRINFNIPLPDGTQLSDLKNNHLLVLSQEYACYIRLSEISGHNTARGQSAKVQRLQNIIRWMNLNNINHFSDLQLFHIDLFREQIRWGPAELLNVYERLESLIKNLGGALPTIPSGCGRKNALAVSQLFQQMHTCAKSTSGNKRILYLIEKTIVDNGLYLPPRYGKSYSHGAQLPKKQKIGTPSITEYLSVFSELFFLRNRLSNDKILFDPFPYTSVSKSAQSLGKKVNRTPTPPVEITMELIDKSIRWVLNYGPETLDLVQNNYKKTLDHALIKSNQMAWASENRNLVRPALVNYIDINKLTIRSFAREINGVTANAIKNFIENTRKSTGKLILQIIEHLTFRKSLDLSQLTPFIFDKYAINEIHIGKEHLHTTMKNFCANYTPVHTGPAQPWPLHWSPFTETKKHLSVFSVMTNVIPMACFIVIATFTARRKSEIWTITDDCITHINDFPFIDTFIKKTLQRNEETPCPELVMKAVDLLQKWSEEARRITGDNKLFQIKEPESDYVWKTESVAKYIKKYTRFIQLSPMPDGTYWKFNAHQFRRFFSMMFMWRYRLGELSALKEQLCHDSTIMTKKYVTNLVDAEILAEVDESTTRKIIVDTISGKHSSCGGFGERLKQMSARIKKMVRKNLIITSSDEANPMINEKINSEVGSRIEDAILKSTKRAKPNPWGWCFCGSHPNDIRLAGCVSQKTKNVSTEPRLENAVITTCAPCPHSLVDETFLAHWISERDTFKSAAEDNSNPEMLRELSREKFNILDKFIEVRFDESTNS